MHIGYDVEPGKIQKPDVKFLEAEHKSDVK